MFRMVGIVIVLATALLVASTFALMGAGIVIPVVFLAALIWLVRVAGATHGH